MGRHCHLEYQLTHETVPTSHCLSDLSLPKCHNTNQPELPKCHNTNRPELRATVETLLARALWPFQTVLFERLHFLLTLCQYHRKPPAIAGYQGNSFPVIPALPSVNSSFSVDACLTGWGFFTPAAARLTACFCLLLSGLKTGSRTFQTKTNHKIASEVSFSSSKGSPLSR